MYRVKQLLGASLTLRNYNAQVGDIRHYQSTQHAYLKEVFGYIDATTLIDMMITPVLTGCTISLVQRC
ncbi:hypothetical protein JCM19053_9 [Vibrio sp. JCM 19053]|nr:hypothetical protein JCM19053_9 [Vibrio sp. JCM 19053]